MIIFNLSKLRLEREADAGGVFVPIRLQHVAELAAVAENFGRYHMIDGVQKRDETLFRVPVMLQQLGNKRRKKKKLLPPLKVIAPDTRKLSRHDALRLAIVLAECLQNHLRIPDSVASEAWLDSLGIAPPDHTTRLNSKIHKAKPRIIAALLADDAMSMSSVEANAEIVQWVNAHTTAKGTSALKLSPRSVLLTSDEKLRYKSLADLPSGYVQFRFAVLKIFNRHVSESLELVDLTLSQSAGTGWSLGAKLRALGHCIFHDTKRRLLQAAIETTEMPSNNGLSVTLDNNAVWDSLDRSLTTPSTSRCLFVQAFERLNKVSNSCLRAKLDARDRLFEVKFAREVGLDWGGLYRDAILRMADELFVGNNIDLFQLTPNGRHSSGLNNDKFVPNPLRTSPLALEMYVFVGKLLGISMRHAAFLPFELAPIVWKLLVGRGALVVENPCEIEDAAAVAAAKEVEGLASASAAPPPPGLEESDSGSEEDESEGEGASGAAAGGGGGQDLPIPAAPDGSRPPGVAVLPPVPPPPGVAIVKTVAPALSNPAPASDLDRVEIGLDPLSALLGVTEDPPLPPKAKLRGRKLGSSMTPAAATAVAAAAAAVRSAASARLADHSASEAAVVEQRLTVGRDLVAIDESGAQQLLTLARAANELAATLATTTTIVDISAGGAAQSKVDDETVGGERVTIKEVRVRSMFSGMTFVATSSTGREVELVTGARGIAVGAHNCREYVNMVAQFRLHEFDRAIDAIREGITAVVPGTYIYLYVTDVTYTQLLPP